MHKNIDKIKELEGAPKVIKNLFSKNEIEKFLDFTENYQLLFITKNKTLLRKDGLKIIMKS